MNHDERNAATAASLMPNPRDDALAADGDGLHARPGETPDEAFFRQHYRETDYYSTGRDWSDYVFAYRYGRLAHALHPGQRFEDLESMLAHEWCAAKEGSRLVWAEARGAVLDAWRLEDTSAPVADRDTAN